MPRRIPLRAGWATKHDTSRIWNATDLRRRKRLNAIELIWDADSMFTSTRLAELAGISRRQLCRWIRNYNEGGLEQLLNPPRRPIGRKRTVSVQDYNAKILPLVDNKEKLGIPWTVADIQRELATEHDLQVPLSTLQRYLAGSGLRSPRSKARQQQVAPWSLPWPQDYGTSLADYLAQTGQSV